MIKMMTGMLAAVAVALALGACARTIPLPLYECVWTECSPKTLAMSRCASAADLETATFQVCMRYEGYERRAGPRERPECWTGVQAVRER